jgi:hypothetical protein
MADKSSRLASSFFKPNDYRPWAGRETPGTQIFAPKARHRPPEPRRAALGYGAGRI